MNDSAKPNVLLCKGCWQHMKMPIPLRGPISIPFRVFGIRPSQMNPNLCTICETNFTRVKRRKQIVVPTTILFADVRGYTGLSETLGAEKMANMLHCFYDNCTKAVWEKDGIVNKFIGDAALAIFNFPIMQDDHVQQAVWAALDLLKACDEQKEQVTAEIDGENLSLGVGIGIHTGEASIGELGSSYKEFTAIGPVVNLASRIQGQAEPGEVLVTEDVYQVVADSFPHAEKRVCDLKGVDHPVTGYVLVRQE
mgnify:CR=1 FL=1